MWRLLGLILIIILAGCNATIDAPPPTLARSVEVFTLQPWETASANLNGASDRTEWQFFGRAGEIARLRVISPNGIVTMTLQLRGNVLAEGSTIEIPLPENEVYRVTVRQSGDDFVSYDIGLSYPNEDNPNIEPTIAQVVGIPTPTPQYANLGEFISQLNGSTEIGSLLSAESPRHVYTFEGQSNDIITIEMQRVAGTLDPTLYLYDPDGQPLAMDDNSGGNGNARLLNIRLPQDGLYSIQAQGAGLFGDYTLRLTTEAQTLSLDSQPTPLPTAITPFTVPTVGPALPDQRLEDHVPVIGNIAREGDFQRFSFLAEAGDSLSIGVRPYRDSGVLTRFELFDTVGNLIASGDSISGTSIFTGGINIEETGAVILLITGLDNTTGAYLVSIGRGTSTYDVFEGEVLNNEQVTGTLQARGERHIWRIRLNPGDVITAAASPTGSQFDPVLELATLDGQLLYRNDNGGADNAALIDIANITEPANYVLRVFDVRGDSQGSYVLLWRYVNVAGTPTPLPDKATILSVDDTVAEGAYQFYVFQGTAGQEVEISVLAAPDTSLDPVAALLAPDGTVIAEADDSNGTLNPIFRVVLPEDGTYSVRVNGYLSGGRFDLFVALLI